jgi:hypothetical protein
MGSGRMVYKEQDVLLQSWVAKEARAAVKWRMGQAEGWEHGGGVVGEMIVSLVCSFRNKN